MTGTYDAERALEVLAGTKGDPCEGADARDQAAARLLAELAALNGRASVTVECVAAPFVLRVTVGEVTVGVRYADGAFNVLGPGPGMHVTAQVEFDAPKQRFAGAEHPGPRPGRRDALVELAAAIARQMAADLPRPEGAAGLP